MIRSNWLTRSRLILFHTKPPGAHHAPPHTRLLVCGGAFLLLLSWLRGEQLHGAPTAQALWAWLYLVFFGSLIAFNAYMYLLSRVRPALATSYAFVNPVIALFLGVALAGERVTGFAYVAVVLVLVGIAFILRKGQTKSSNT